MNLKNLTDNQLHASTLSAAKREREETINLLKHLSEIERRHLFSKFACDSLHAYCVDHLKMSEPQAGRRVSASRLLNELPAIEEKVRTGSMTLTSVCQANSFFRKEAAAGNRLEAKEKLELIGELEGQASRKVEQILMSKTAQPEIHLKETVKQRTATFTEIKIHVDDETLEQLNRLKEIFSHAMPNASYAQIISKLAKAGLEKFDPAVKARRAVERMAKEELKDSPALVQNLASTSDSLVTPAPERNEVPANGLKTQIGVLPDRRPRNIPSSVKHAVWMRDLGRCTFVDSKTGECCGSRKFLELDHIISFAKGGEHKAENLRLRCRAHNHRHAIESFGPALADRYRQSTQFREIGH